jgi:SecDF, P1 head subdomain
VSADSIVAVPRSYGRLCVRRRVNVASAVTFVLLVASALVSFSPTPFGFRTPAAGLHRLSGSVVADLVSARPVLCSAPGDWPSVRAPAAPLPESCQPQYAPSVVKPLGSGYTTNAPVPDPALAAFPSTLTEGTNAAHSSLLDSLAGKSGTPTRYLLGPRVNTLSHHNAKPANVTTKNGPSIVHIVFTQAGAERWDAVASANLHKVVAFIFGDDALSDPIIEPTNTCFTTFDEKVQIFFGNLSAAQAHQFASTL